MVAGALGVHSCLSNGVRDGEMREEDARGSIGFEPYLPVSSSPPPASGDKDTRRRSPYLIFQLSSGLDEVLEKLTACFDRMEDIGKDYFCTVLDRSKFSTSLDCSSHILCHAANVPRGKEELFSWFQRGSGSTRGCYLTWQKC